MSSDNSPKKKGTEDSICSDGADSETTTVDTSMPAINSEADAVTVPAVPEASESEALATPQSQPVAKPSAPTVSEPAPVGQATAPAVQPSTPISSIAERVQVPAQAPSGDSDESGGEWEMLSGRIKEFLEGNNLVEWWQKMRQPLILVGVLIGLILTLRIYGGILDAIATVPLAPRLFQLVGAIYAAWYAATRLVKSNERKQVSSNLQDLWTSIRGGRKG